MNEVADHELPTQEIFRTDLRTLCQGAIRVALEVVLEEEIQSLVGAKKWARQAQRVDSRNGTYLRRLITTMGAIDLKVPRSREGGSAGGAVFGRYKRRSAEIDDAMVTAYVHGASTRDIGQITEALMGEHVSRSSVSRAAKTLGTKVEDLRNAPIEGPIPYLYLDATFLDARWAREVENVSALVAYGVGLDGHRQLLGTIIGAEESEESWSELLAQLNKRGLSGVQLVIADGHAGLAKAVRRSSAAASISSGTSSPRRPRSSGRGSPRRSGRSSWPPPRPRPAGGWPSSRPASGASSRSRWHA
jgi:transposase-like protein